MDTNTEVFGAIYKRLSFGGQESLARAIPASYALYARDECWRAYAIKDATPVVFDHIQRYGGNINRAIEGALLSNRGDIALKLLNSPIARGSSRDMTQAITLGYEDVAIALLRKVRPSSIDISIASSNKMDRFISMLNPSQIASGVRRYHPGAIGITA